MKRKFILAALLIFGVCSIYCQDLKQEYLVQILTYMNNNNLMIYNDSTVLSSERAIHLFLNDKIARLGKNNYIEFHVRTKKNGLYRAYFLMRDSNGQFVDTFAGNITPISTPATAARNYYSMENLDALTVLFRYREKEPLSLGDYVYLLNSLLYKDETIDSMIAQKYANGETKTSDDKKRIAALKQDQIGSKMDIYNIAQLVVDGYLAENASLAADTANQKLVQENERYIVTYRKLKESMSKQLKALRTK